MVSYIFKELGKYQKNNKVLWEHNHTHSFMYCLWLILQGNRVESLQ